MRHLAYLAAALCVAAAPIAARADTAADYNLFTLKNLTMQGNSVQGRVAVGGAANLTNYSVASNAAAGDVNLVVKGDLSMTGGSVKGQTSVGGTPTYIWYGAPNLSSAPAPVDFAAEGLRVVALSNLLKTFDPVGTVNSVTWGGANNHGTQFTLTGTSSGLNVFDIDGAALHDANTFNLVLGAGATALINVSGTNVSFGNMGFSVSGGGNNSSVLWNFADATTLSMYSAGLTGSVLAPNADYTGSGVIHGQVIVNSFTGTYGLGTAITNDRFAGALLGLDPFPHTAPLPEPQAAVPEPATWALLIGGFGLVGAMLRRRRAAAAYA